MATGGAKAGVGNQDKTGREMAKAVLAVVSSSHFNKEEIRQNKLTLSQAYCLLWLDSESGDVDGRKYRVESNGGATAAMLVDLVVMGRAGIVVVPNKTLGIRNDHIVVKMLSVTPTGTFLDGSHICKSIAAFSINNPGKARRVKDWILQDVTRIKVNEKCTTQALRSLVEQGILKEEKTSSGYKYPLAKPEVREALVKDIRAVALEEAQPSSYIRALLTLACASANLFHFSDPILKKHFSREEYGKAKERINALFGIDVKEKRKTKM